MESPEKRTHRWIQRPFLPVRQPFMYDAGLKRIFSHARVVEELVRSHLAHWAGALDFATLEPLGTEFFTGGLGRRHADLAWTAGFRDGERRLLLLIEIQGRPRRDMALRTSVYATLAAEKLLERDRELARDPGLLVVEALVLYHGDRRWTAPRRTEDLLGGSGPHRYHLVLPARRRDPDPGRADFAERMLGLASRWTAGAFARELPALARALRTFGDDALERRVADTLAAMIPSEWDLAERLKEVMDMDTMTKRFMDSLEEIRLEGVRLGRRQGRKRGRGEGQAALVLRQAERKFGAAAARQLSLLLEADGGSRRLAEVGDAVVDCATASEFLGRARVVMGAD